MNRSSNPAGLPPEGDTWGLAELPQRVPAADRQIWATALLTQSLVEPRDNWSALARSIHLIGPLNSESGYRYLSYMVELEQYFPVRPARLLAEIAGNGKTDGVAASPHPPRAQMPQGGLARNAILCLDILDDIYFSRLNRFPADVHCELTAIVRQPEGAIPSESEAASCPSSPATRPGARFLELVQEQLAGRPMERRLERRSISPPAGPPTSLPGEAFLPPTSKTSTILSLAAFSKNPSTATSSSPPCSISTRPTHSPHPRQSRFIPPSWAVYCPKTTATSSAPGPKRSSKSPATLLARIHLENPLRTHPEGTRRKNGSHPVEQPRLPCRHRRRAGAATSRASSPPAPSALHSAPSGISFRKHRLQLPVRLPDHIHPVTPQPGHAGNKAPHQSPGLVEKPQPGRLLFLNASILTTYGVYRYEPVTPEAAQQLIAEFRRTGRDLYSAVGHRATAALMTRLLGIDVPFNRVTIEQAVGEPAIVLRLNQRPPEGLVLSIADIEAIGYELGLVTRLE